VIRLDAERRALALWAWGAGLTLWAPALAVPAGGLPLQPMDLVVLAGWPLLAVFARRLPPAMLGILATGLLSVAASWTAVGGQALILIWTLGLAFPLVALAALTAAEPRAARAFVSAFLTGAGASALLFLAQIAVGAENLDFRNNPAFRLPPHFGRGFALFPEVSTFAAHSVIAFGTALALALHPQTAPGRRQRLLLLVALLALALLLTRSTSVVLLLPVITGLALAKTTRASVNTLILAGLVTAVFAALILVFLQSLYIERIESDAAQRSASMRLASILGGLTPLARGEVFGVGIGNNAEIAQRAFEVARDLGLSFGKLPDGVNAQLIGRIFEEGWPAVLQFAVAGAVLLSALLAARSPTEIALACLAAGSLLVAVAVIGYRGIYTTWLWLALPAGLIVLATRRRRALRRWHVP
jgi:hypothetical protein